MVNRSGSEKMVLRGKKAMFFTISVIIIIALLGASYIIYSNISDRESIQDRVSTMNNYLLSIEKDLSRQVYISGFRAIFVIEKEIAESGNFNEDVNASFKELFFNGTLNGNSQEVMEGATFSDIESFAASNAQKINTVLKLSNPEMQITQNDPWNVNIILTINIELSDAENIARWNKTETISSYIPIENFEDPVYALNTNNLVTNNITKTPFEVFNFSEFSVHALNSYYKASEYAPSFLDRLGGNLSPNPNGIESFVNLQELSSQGFIITEKSCLDYAYFSSQNPPSSHITGMPSWFMIEDSRKADYNLA